MSARTSDVVVIGAGTMGAWTAFRANRAGFSSLLVDAYGAGHPRATSGDETRIIRAAHGPDTFYARWSREAREDWIRFGEEWGERLFVDAGVLWFASRLDGFEAASETTLRELGIPVERLSPDELCARWPQVDPDGLAFGLFEPEAGVLMARRGIQAVTRAFAHEGGRFELAVVRPGRSDGRRLLDVESADGTRLAGGEFVFACGPWLPRLFPEVLGDLIRVTKQDVFFVGPPAGDGRFAAEWLPAWVDYDAAFYGIPAIDGRGLKAATDRYGPVFDPSFGERIVDPESARLTHGYLGRRFPALVSAPVVETRVCQYETTPDSHFVVDRHPAFDNVWLVGGGSGHGFKHGPRIGEHVVARLQGAEAGSDEERFSILRSRHAEVGPRTGGDSAVAAWRGY